MPALERFIPTPVGNTCNATPRYRPATVHPHARGEHGKFDDVVVVLCGSSPRPWGTRHFPKVRQKLHRFIPTPVGNTHHLQPKFISVAVHPHARGEHSEV